MVLELNNLTTQQEGLVKELVNEFQKINPKPKETNGIKRFSFDTINECATEEVRFRQTISKHNLTMMKVFISQFENDIKEFKNEFGKTLSVQIGCFYNSEQQHTIEKLVEKTKDRPLDVTQDDIQLFIVSKSKRYNGDSRYNYCDYKQYKQIYCGFKTERVGIVLSSGKEVNLDKIVGLEYRLRNWLYRKETKNYSTLDELIQSEKSIQQAMVEMSV